MSFGTLSMTVFLILALAKEQPPRKLEPHPLGGGRGGRLAHFRSDEKLTAEKTRIKNALRRQVETGEAAVTPGFCFQTGVNFPRLP